MFFLNELHHIGIRQKLEQPHTFRKNYHYTDNLPIKRYGVVGLWSETGGCRIIESCLLLINNTQRDVALAAIGDKTIIHYFYDNLMK